MTYGMKATVSLAFQNSGGTLNTNSLHHLAFLDESFSHDIEQIISQAMRGRLDEGDHYEGMHSIGGGLNIEAHPIDMGVLLRAVLGPPTTTTSDAIYTHVFEPRAADFDERFAGDPMTIQKYLNAGSAWLLYDMVANGLNMSISGGELLKMGVDFVGGQFSEAAAVAASYRDGKPYTWNQGSFDMAGAALTDLRELSLALGNSIEARHNLVASSYPWRYKRSASRTIALSGNMDFASQDEYQEFLSQSERALDVTFKNAVAIQSGYTEEVRIQAPLFRHTQFSPQVGGPGQIEVGFSGKGVYSATSATALRITLINTLAAY